MRDIFLQGTLTVLLNLLYQRRVIDINDYCNSVLKMTGELYGFTIKKISNFDKVVADITKKTIEIKGQDLRYVDIFNVSINVIREHLNDITDIEWPKYDLALKDPEQAWNTVDSIFIWEWIHIVTIHLDLRAGIHEKIAFIKFVKTIIGCGICQSHYNAQINSLIEGLTRNSLTDSFLILHSSIPIGEKYNSNNITYVNKQKQEYFMGIFIDILKRV